ncbi:MAG TPA: AAA family ATPase, partial [Actinomycetota bacterium]|nr:AAA family ATPase [Actinomycetota bacterium]
MVGKPGFVTNVKLVGRTQELATLDAEWRRAQTGAFRCVLLSGDPGMGKTRLTDEVLRRHRGIGLRARAFPLGETSSFGMWAEALDGHLAALSAEELDRLCGGFLEDLAAVLRSIPAVCGLSPTGEPASQTLMKGLTALLDGLSRTEPVTVILDDVHLADSSSWETLHYLARSLPRSRLLVIAAGRPAELAESRIGLEVMLSLEHEGLLTRIDLKALSELELSRLAEMVLGEYPSQPLMAWLAERSQGIPLFALTLLQALVEEEVDPSQPRLQALPGHLVDRIVGRLRGLTSEGQQMLELLAVVGRRIDLMELIPVTGEPLERLAPVLDGLVQSRLVREEHRGGRITYEIA